MKTVYSVVMFPDVMGASKPDENINKPYSEMSELKKGLRYIKHARHYLISHHPHCKYYDKDVLRIGKLRICWGCMVDPVRTVCSQ